jgi:SPP1 gp7 family putative phage head morphogenesis protein
MNKRQKEVQQQFLDNEKAVLKRLEKSYQVALAEINSKIESLLARQDADMQHVIYRVEYQKALRTQVQTALEQLHNAEFETLSGFLAQAYEDGFIGTVYDLQGQGVPLVFPIDQKQVVAAVQHETQLSSALYVELGHDIKDLSKKISAEISRGIATGAMYGEMARNIASYANIPKNRAMTIARTEAHRIQSAATADAQWKAKEKGADVVKQWDSSLDGRTRDTHRQLDGQIRELDEPFEVAGKKAMYPGGFGDPAEDCNCRCTLLTRARKALDINELRVLQKRAATFGLDKTKDFEEFKKKYLDATK